MAVPLKSATYQRQTWSRAWNGFHARRDAAKLFDACPSARVCLFVLGEGWYMFAIVCEQKRQEMLHFLEWVEGMIIQLKVRSWVKRGRICRAFSSAFHRRHGWVKLSEQSGSIICENICVRDLILMWCWGDSNNIMVYYFNFILLVVSKI